MKIKDEKIFLDALENLPEDVNSVGIGDFLCQIQEKNTEEERLTFQAEVAAANEAQELPAFWIATEDLNVKRYVNRYLIQVNEALPQNGFFVCSFASAEERHRQIYAKYPRLLAKMVYAMDFIWHRMMPKLKLLKKVYFKIYHKVKREYPIPEILGRLSFCGFSIRWVSNIRGITYVVGQKTGQPSTDEHPSYGLLVSLRRVGKNGKRIGVYKFRTMYAYSEYLQGYAYDKNHLDDTGKIADDFRVSGWGRKLRKYWLDELPMFFNVLKGEMKLVGVRPLSEHYYSLYTPEMQQYRIKARPGMLPPYYVDMPHTLEEIQANEKRYLDAYFAHPLRTQWVYFWKIMYSILVKRRHSK